jgi:hypothetical protein
MLNDLRRYLDSLHLPQDDEVQSSKRTFPDKAHFRIEIAAVNSVQCFQGLLSRSRELGLIVNRVTETWGISRHTNEELRAYLDLGKEHGIEIVFSTRTQPGLFAPTNQNSADKLQGMEQIIEAADDVRRVTELGARNVMVYDEGLLWVLHKMRSDQKLPENLRIKTSVHMAYSNTAALRVLEVLGADSISVARHLSLSTIIAARQAIQVPMDVHADNPPQYDFMRAFEAPSIVRSAAPVYLKAGSSELFANSGRTGTEHGRRMAEVAMVVRDMIARRLPEASQSAKGTYLSNETRYEIPSLPITI